MEQDSTTSLQGERTTLEAAYREHFAALMRVALLLTGSVAAAVDAVQEVFLRCVDRLGTIEHPQSYLRASVVNECRTQHRREQRRREIEDPPFDDHLPSELIETREALAGLTHRQRAAIVLRYFLDLPEDDIADVLGCRPNTVRSLIHRALRQLRRDLA